jgi:hypothetical protein
LGAHATELERTSLGPQAPPQNLRPFSQMRRRNQKNRTRIGPHLRQSRTAESQVISVAKIDYVRRSELHEMPADDLAISVDLIPVDCDEVEGHRLAAFFFFSFF